MTLLSNFTCLGNLYSDSQGVRCEVRASYWSIKDYEELSLAADDNLLLILTIQEGQSRAISKAFGYCKKNKNFEGYCELLRQSIL